ncbi:hypothetical protein [Massilibacteroides vaginae]|uniref:hypothetical protein n=1 Tax=Massilibacteroides vaginae TaxID=1673718 RepID=UPI000A1CC84E|nr:hypothetical protein [Massilibacteroides vaginae]
MGTQNKIKIMRRNASDNKYLHKDFHLSMNILLNYIYNNWGKEALISYLQQYTCSFHKPLSEQIKIGNIHDLAIYFKEVYKKEEWPVQINHGKDFLEIEQSACPGISHIKSKGELPCPLYIETYRTVYNTLCLNTPFEYTLEYYDEETGACKQIFKRKG